ncbi:MAG: PP2C family protein-serine/threonine phosphatase [Planctomycetota bacterium]
MSSHASISCSEVWGGNRAVEAALVLPGVSGWVCSRPFEGAKEGGDVHYVSSCGTGRITRVMLADVSGHGTAVAETGRGLRRVMQRYLNHERPQALAKRLNRDMKELAGDSGRFATALVITFYSPRGRLSICNAGHPSPLVYRAAKGTWDTIDQPNLEKKVSNLPLGVVEGSGYVGRELTLDLGDMVVGYTDCLTEARSGSGKMLGEEGLLEIMRKMPREVVEGSPSGLAEAVIEAVERRGCVLDDDLTAVVLRCTRRSHGAGVRAFFGGVWRVVKQLRDPGALPWPDGLLR